MTLYEQAREAGIPCDHHGSDLYVQDCEEARELLEKWRALHHSPKLFRSQVDGKMWWDVPFAYDPHWSRRVSKRPTTTEQNPGYRRSMRDAGRGRMLP